MSSENVTQLIEKQREKSSLQHLWNNEENLTDVSQENRIYENSFTASSVSGINNVDRHLAESNRCKTDLMKLNNGVINLDKTKIAKEDFKMLGMKGMENVNSDHVYLQKLHPEIKEFEHAESEIGHSKMVNSVHPLQESVRQNGYKNTEGKFSRFNVLSNTGTMQGALEPQKRSETHENNVHDGISLHRDSSAVPTGIAGNESELKQDNVQIENTEKAHANSNIKTEENDAEMKSSATVEEVMDIDEVDYYDSEDEYWNTHDVDDYQYDYVDDIQSSTASTPTSGRYSQGVEQVRNIPVFKRSIRKFAFDNNFEVHDVIPDGNCMFRALSDQLLINGFPGHTEASLRKDAITYLRSKPFKEDGGHDSSFLSDETWEEYLNRMERSREWGDHIVLQALVDVYCLQVIVFNVFQEDIRRTEVLAESDVHNDERLTVFLGHLGEFHYLSLRPKNWFEQWPYKMLICRLEACSIDLKQQDPEEIIRCKISKMGANRYISNNEIDKTSQILSRITGQYKMQPEDSVDTSLKRGLFISFSGQDLELEDTEDSQASLIEDPLLSDSVSGIPLLHLSIILMHLIPAKMIYNPIFPPHNSVASLRNIGSVIDGTEFIRLNDISQSQKMIDFYNNQLPLNCMILLKPDLEAVLFKDGDKDSSLSVIYIDMSKTKPGYCRLVFPDDYVPETDQVTQRTDSGLYLEGFDIPDLPNATDIEMTTFGIRCAFSIVGIEWFCRKRHFDFPSLTLRLTIFGGYCTLVPKAHHQSDNPAIEWKVNFSLVECLLVKSLSIPQRYGFNIFKILLDNMTFHLERRLKTSHLKAVFFQACEEFPSSFWESNLGGCILFLLSKLISCFKKRLLPHYFIPQRNLIDHFSTDDINILCVVVESVRVCPVQVIQFVADKHGIAYGEKLVRSILVDSVSFAHTRDVIPVVDRVNQETYRTAKFLSRLGLYDSTLGLLSDVHKLSKFSTGHNTRTSFYDFVNDALQQLRQRSSRIILARMYDNRFGTKMISSYLKESEQSLARNLSWKTDFRINWLEVSEEKAGDLISIAEFLYEHSLDEYHKRNANLATEFIKTAILCIKNAVQDSIDEKTIEDMELKHDVLEQKRELKATLKKYYIHVVKVSSLYRAYHPLMEHIMDIEDICKEFPEMTCLLVEMFRRLRMYDKSNEYAEKLQKQPSK